MTEEQKTKLLQDVCAAIEKLKEQYGKDVFKYLEIPPLVNIRTGQYIGFAVVFQLSIRYRYTEKTLNAWKTKLKADEWDIKIDYNRLYLTFKVRYKEG